MALVKLVNNPTDVGDSDHVGGPDWDQVAAWINAIKGITAGQLLVSAGDSPPTGLANTSNLAYINVGQTYTAANIFAAGVTQTFNGPVTLAGTVNYSGAGNYTGLQTFDTNDFAIWNPAKTFKYIIATSAIVTSDKIVTLPLLTANDTFMMLTMAQTVQNKTLDSTNTISSTASLPANLSKIDSAATYTAMQTFKDDLLQIQNPAGTFNYIFSTAAVVANRIVSLPLLAADASFVFDTHANTFTGLNTYTVRQLFSSIGEAIRLINGGAINAIDSGALSRNLIGVTAGDAINIGASAGWLQMGFFIGGERFRLTSAGVTISPEWTVNQVFSNNLAIQQKDSGGNARNILRLNTTDGLVVGTSVGLTEIDLFSGNVSAAMAINSSNLVTTSPTWGVNLPFNNNLNITMKDTGGSQRLIAKINSANRLILGDSAGVIETQILSGSATGNVLLGSDSRMTLTVAAQAGVSETLMQIKMSDDANTYFGVLNNTTVDGVFAPRLVSSMFSANTHEYLVQTDAASDAGTVALMTYTIRRNDNTVITTRPLIDITNRGNLVYRINPNGDALLKALAQAGVAESLFKLQVADNITAYLLFSNGSATDAVFEPKLQTYNFGAGASLASLRCVHYIEAAADTGAAPILIYDARRSTEATITARELVEWRNFGVGLMTLYPKGKLTLDHQDEGAEETTFEITMSDDASSWLRFSNAIGGVANSYVPRIWGTNGLANNSYSGLYIYGSILSGQDTGGVGVISLDGRVGSGSVLGTRPMVTIRNNSTIVYSFTPTKVDLGAKLLTNVYGVQADVTQRYVSSMIPPTTTFRGSAAYNEGSTVTGSISSSNDASGGFVRVTAAASIDALAQYVSAIAVTTRSSNPKWQWTGSFDSVVDVRYKMGFITTPSFAVGATTIAGANAGFAFRFIHGVDTTFQLVTNDALGGAEQVLDLGFTPLAATGYCFELAMDTATGTVTATIYNYTTGAVLGTVSTTTQVPTTSHNLFRVCRSENITATAKAFVTRWEKLYKNGTGPALPF
jgi:hypothetical protein